MKYRVLLLAALALNTTACSPPGRPSPASQVMPPGKITDFNILYGKNCAGCHGENGISTTENIPSLAGQPDQFIQWQLVFFRAGTRKNEQMQPIA